MEQSIKAQFEHNLISKVPKIIGVGDNYLETRYEKPMIFAKAFNCLTQDKVLEFPPELSVEYELELGIVIGKEGKITDKNNYQEFIGGYFLLMDFTDDKMFESLRGLQQSWYKAKAMDQFLPVSEFIPIEKIPDPHNVNLRLLINGEEIFNVNTSKMNFNIGEILEHISKNTTLYKGDLILTGTPKWGTIVRGSNLEGYLLDNNGQTITSLNVQVK